MNKVINGKHYNTETAQELAKRAVAETSAGHACSYERLYRKRTGEYFTCTDGDAWEYGVNVYIKTLAFSEAKAWAEKWLDGSEYIGIFGDAEE